MTEAMFHVLVIEDEPDIRQVLRVQLAANGYRVTEAENAGRGEVEAKSGKPDLLVVDLGLPDLDGIELIRRVRRWSSVPILVLSARAMEEQKIAALDAGADDYVTKPFSAPELLARTRAALRRNTKAPDRAPVLALGAVRLDLERRETAGPQGPIHLTPLEYRVVECLARHPGSIVTQGQLIREVWGPHRLGDTRGLRLCVKNIRGKIEPDPARPRFLVTETGLGYRLMPEEPGPPS